MKNYNIQHEKLCKTLQLGDLILEPQELSGGLIHRMFAFQTTKGKYAIKALNPQVMGRPEAFQNFINSEMIAFTMSKSINAVPAKKYNNKVLQELDGQFYLIFDWCDGKNIFGDDISAFHCEEIGRILAIVHETDFIKLGLNDNYTYDETVPNWNSYLNKGIALNAPWVQVVRENIEKLYDYSNLVCSTAKVLSENTVITHCDLEPKNVLWQDKVPYIIDWEAAGFVNPYHDLIETAVYWSKDNNEQLVKDKFLAFIQGYKDNIPNLQSDWNVVLDKGFSGMLGWLEYSLKRSVWIECTDENENKLGTEHVSGTIYNINKYAENRKELYNWLKEM